MNFVEKNFSGTDEQKQEIKGLMEKLITLIVPNYNGFKYADNPLAQKRMRKEFLKFAIDNITDESIEAVCDALNEHFDELATGPKYTLLTRYFDKDNRECVEWHIDNTLNACLSMAQNNAKDNEISCPNFTIYNNWSGAIYDDFWIQERIRTLVISVTTNGCLQKNEITNSLSDAERIFNDFAVDYEWFVKNSTLRISDVRPHGNIFKQEIIETDDDRTITITIKEHYDCDILVCEKED